VKTKTDFFCDKTPVLYIKNKLSIIYNYNMERMDTPIIQTEYGNVIGIRKHGCDEFLGIPFAEPPVGDLRFRHPVKKQPWTGLYFAVKGPKNPIQAKSRFSTGNNSEDCLYLNIFAPSDRKEKLPVMVWIYGGAYKIGGIGCKNESTDVLEYELGYFAKATNTIVVSVNYRLNVYGFLNLHFLGSRFDMNNGMYDQLMALQFVHDNIDAFGGDKDNITVFGQSAGGACTLALMTSELSSGLFQKAIVQSPSVDHFWTEKESEKVALDYLRILGVDKDYPERIMYKTYDKIGRAINLVTDKLILSGNLTCAFSPVIDGVFIKDYPKRLMKSCTKNLLIGYNKEEMRLYTNKAPNPILRVYSKVVKLDVRDGEEPYRERMTRALSNKVIIDPTMNVVNNYPGKVWLYNYRYVTKEMAEMGLGCCHIAEFPVLFNWTNAMSDAHDPKTQRVGKMMRAVWKEFAWSELSVEPYSLNHSKIIFE
jgi:para-nitrobenzyl esterase